MKSIGLYIHVPFCRAKCPYCDFYSVIPRNGIQERYVEAVTERLRPLPHLFDTVYFGGGTPSVLGAKGLTRILDSVRDRLTPDCEITTELNPTGVDRDFFTALKSGGFNRISMGMQSANEKELKALGRRHDAKDVENAVRAAQGAGFTNISLDLMLGVPGSSYEEILRSAELCLSLGVTHLSVYMLKIEPGTPYAAMSLNLPSEDQVCDWYLSLAAALADRGFPQYEISNFSPKKFESRHNLKYWHCEEYMGIGPAAHLFVDGKRFYYPRDLCGFLAGDKPIFDSLGGDAEEYAMLGLRLNKGLSRRDCESRYGGGVFDLWLSRAKKLPPQLVTATQNTIALTTEGFLVSNTLIARVIGG